jgi:hypothetical protein
MVAVDASRSNPSIDMHDGLARIVFSHIHDAAAAIVHSKNAVFI